MKLLNQLIRFVYAINLCKISLIIALSVVVWCVVGLVVYRTIEIKRGWKMLNVVVCLLTFAVILYLTLFSRTAYEVQEVCLTPFYSFYEAQWNKEIYRSMFMNVFLFVPLGLSLPNVFGVCWKHKFTCSILLALAFSVVIELLQYYFQFGCVEVDDVICNTLGGSIGASAYVMTQKCRMIFTKGEEQETSF